MYIHKKINIIKNVVIKILLVFGGDKKIDVIIVQSIKYSIKCINI